MKTDIEIAQEAQMLPIEQVAQGLGLAAQSVSPYGRYKAKLDHRLLTQLAQQPDGYINTYFTLKEPQNRFKNLWQGHELYCAGHLFEAAVAYARATGKRAVLDTACRFADYLTQVFGTGEGQLRGYPGHQEVEDAPQFGQSILDGRSRQ